MRTNAKGLATALSLVTGRSVFIRDRLVQRKWGTRRCKESRAFDLGRRTFYFYDVKARPHSAAQRIIRRLDKRVSGTVRERIGTRVA